MVGPSVITRPWEAALVGALDSSIVSAVHICICVYIYMYMCVCIYIYMCVWGWGGGGGGGGVGVGGLYFIIIVPADAPAPNSAGAAGTMLTEKLSSKFLWTSVVPGHSPLRSQWHNPKWPTKSHDILWHLKQSYLMDWNVTTQSINASKMRVCLIVLQN